MKPTTTDMERSQTFSSWLEMQRRRDDEVGVFALEAAKDENADRWTTRDDCIADLASHGTTGASNRFIRAAHLAWDEYEQ